MPGVRLTHARLRGGTLVVEHPRIRYVVPYHCLVCGIRHERKTYHLRLDGEGAVIVSETVLEHLREIGLEALGLRVENEVRRPPAQVIAMDGRAVRGGRLYVPEGRLVDG